MVHVPSIEEWLSGKNIFITGGTGFIGKVLIEKLLRSCPSIGTIYILVRAKRGKTPEERHHELSQNEIFKFSGLSYDFSKLVLISGDLSVSGMALNEEDIRTLHNNAQVVFHIAASVRFTDPLLDAIKINARLTRDIVELAKGMKNLEVLAHVSTAYVNSDRIYIEEKLYPPKMDWRKALELSEMADPIMVEALTEAVIGQLPNTYCFSKNMAEHIVWDHRHELPILIYRPVIVVNLKNEPEPGWTDNISGPELIFYAIGKGIIRVVGVDGNHHVILCPGDVTVNGLIAAAWKLACHAKVTGEPADNVINSNYIKRCTNEMIKFGRQLIKETPIPDILWTDYYIPVKNVTLFTILHLLINVLPAIFFQLIIKATGRNFPLLKIMRKYYFSMAHLFAKLNQTEYYMSFKNFDKVISALSPEDQIKFNTVIMVEGENEVDSLKKSVGRMFKLLGERDVTKEDSFLHQRRMLILDRLCRFFLLGLVLYYFPYQQVYSLIAAAVAWVAGYCQDIFMVE